jgi:hypothetical protein
MTRVGNTARQQHSDDAHDKGLAGDGWLATVRTDADDELVVLDEEVVDGAQRAVAHHTLAGHLLLLPLEDMVEDEDVVHDECRSSSSHVVQDENMVHHDYMVQHDCRRPRRTCMQYKFITQSSVQQD